MNRIIALLYLLQILRLEVSDNLRLEATDNLRLEVTYNLRLVNQKSQHDTTKLY